MPIINILVGQAVLGTVVLVGPTGAVDEVSVLTVDTGNPDTLKVRVNPNDPRQVGVLGLASSAGVNAHIGAPGRPTVSQMFAVSPSGEDLSATGVTWAQSEGVPAWLAD